MLAGLGPESWIAGGIGSPLGGAAAVSMGGAILTCSSPTPGSSDISPASAAGASVTATGGVVWLPSTAGSGAGTSTSNSTGTVNTNGPALSSQVGGASGAGGSGASAGTGSAVQGGNDFWLSYGAGSGAGTSTFSSTGAVNTNGPALSSQVGGGSRGCPSAPGVVSGPGGLSVVLVDSAQPSRNGSGNSPGSTGSNTLTLAADDPPPRLTPLVLHSSGNDGPGLVSTVWTGGEGGVQFVLAAEQENEPTAQPLPIRNPGQFVFIVSGSQPGSQVVFDGSTTASTPSDGGSVVPPSGTASYSIFSAVGGLFNLVGGASQAALGVNVVFASGAVTAITEGISSPLTVPLAIGGTVIVVHGLDQAWAGATTIWTGQTQRPYAAQALDPLTGNATASDVVNGGVGIALSGGAGALARGTQVAGQVASKGDEIATAVGSIAGRGDDAVAVVDDVAGSAGSSSAGVASGSLLGADDFASLPKSGRIDPKTIRFSQDSIAPDFKGGVGGVEDLAAKLKSGQVDPSTIPPIRIVVKDGKVFTLDNRRLRAFQEAGIDIPFERLDSIPKSELFKFTTKNDGVDIIIRGANQ